MARIRRIQIKNFRAIKSLNWLPSNGINCLIGPGDSGKSTILEAIDLCLGARRSPTFTDADFHALDVTTPIVISLTLGDLDESVKSLDSYGQFLRGFDAKTGLVEDEPDSGLETVVTLTITVGTDLDPQWALESDRAKAAGVARNLTWGDRTKMAPTRIGGLGEANLAWRRGSVLNRLSDESVHVSAALAEAAREARASFGEHADKQLGKALDVVLATAKSLGIPVGDAVKAMLDIHAVSFSGGAIALHDANGVPLSGLGVGSTRLLIAGLQRQATAKTQLILIDELEHGLEPHRVIQLVDLLGAKEQVPPQQAFVTTHSPAALREFGGDQLFVVRRAVDGHEVTKVGTADDIQGTIRKYPEAFLAPSVIICEGATEVGFSRGLSQFRAGRGKPSLEARGVALVDGTGGGPNDLIARADVFRRLGYRVAVLRDDDKPPDPAIEGAFEKAKGTVFHWRAGYALEDELFRSLPDDDVEKLLTQAIELHGEEVIDAHITSKSNGKVSLSDVRAERALGGYTPATRELLGRAAQVKSKNDKGKRGWFKSLGYMEEVAREIVAPCSRGWAPDFKNTIVDLLTWIDHGGG
ncbi:MAG: AAA family ATPase [Rhizobiales bacterium]|nr:AAA family ATPase [Hyphomicrobiales bacterium]